MAKKDLKKIDLEIEEAKKKVAALESVRKEAEETLQKNIGKLYVQVQLKKDKTLSYEQIYDELKTELALLKEEEKERRKSHQNDQQENEQVS
ncbi:hypothetical protein StDouc24_02755 [Streptococcus thermophilus]|uniref:hypothetical protein n=1 Tax=Streptococcus thermophilus TaxID=1308 RepID=UPI001C64859C|nr:hypothetical protein [Streptococcus thermophilus]MBW7797503.1 hypothetical protein [Streptococcus thermophilus]